MRERSEIIYTEAPDGLDEVLENAEEIHDLLPPPEHLIRRSKKKRVTMMIDEGTVDYFKKLAKDSDTKYQTLINACLETYVEAHRRA